MNYNPLLLLDFYKTTHHEQYPKTISKIVSYYTARISRLDKDDYLISFGLQAFIKEYLIKSFNENFFNRNKNEVINEYCRVLDYTLGKGIVDYNKIEKLHDLGYLPIEMSAIPEGILVPIKVPMFSVTNTHPEFAWLVNSLETALSCSLWHAQISANVGYKYRQVVNHYYDISVDDTSLKNRAISDFSMRGQESVESAIKSSAGFALSFLTTATLPTVLYLEQNYRCDCQKEAVIFGGISTEHSVMNSNYAIDGDEVQMVKRLLNEIYPNNSFSMVSDSYDYWNFVENIIPQCKDDILNHKGFIGIRGDSGNPVEIVTKTVFKLWDIFGGTINDKGYKVLDSHIRAVYGDSITIDRAEMIYKILIENGFACNNVLLGSGSFSMQCLERDNVLLPYTRDTYGIAIKATYCEADGKMIPIFKDPKTDDANFKKSQRGMCAVFYNENGKIDYLDGLNAKTIKEYDPINLLKPVFSNGKMIREQSLQEIRNLLHGGKF